jgi:hypothetical protein
MICSDVGIIAAMPRATAKVVELICGTSSRNASTGIAGA